MEFVQKTNIYHNNEFDNMPSKDFYNSHYRLCRENKNTIDWDEVNRIVNSFGLEYTLITRTFSNPFIDVVVYHKIEEGDDLPAYCHLLHNCIHELDVKTNLYWATSWNGNVGIFGSHDVKRQTYSFGDRIWKWKNILNNWDSSIHDTKRVLREGDYLLMDTSYGKIMPKQVFNDFKVDNMISYMRSISPIHYINKEIGKTAAESNSYEAVVIRDNDTHEYFGRITFDQDINNVVNMSVSAVLGGTYSTTLINDEYEDQIKRAVHYIVG